MAGLVKTILKIGKSSTKAGKKAESEGNGLAQSAVIKLGSPEMFLQASCRKTDVLLELCGSFI